MSKDEIANRVLDYFGFEFDQDEHKLKKNDASIIMLDVAPNSGYWHKFKDIDEFLVALFYAATISISYFNHVFEERFENPFYKMSFDEILVELDLLGA